MAIEMSPAVARALQSAQHAAAGAAAVAVEHLASGLLAELEGAPVSLLTQAGLDMAAVSGPRPPCGGGDGSQGLPLSFAVQQVLQRAADLSADRQITSELVLLALLEQEEPLRRRWEEAGLRLAELRDRVHGAGNVRPVLRLEEPLQLTEPRERMDAARILDAAANRAREALRVLEDHQRFALNDAILSEELKRLRHGLAAALGQVDPMLLLAARETLRDVGTALTTEREQHRYSLADVVQANVKRLQEALRSLEEYGKLHSPALGRQVEQLRYRSYTLERALVRGAAARHRLADARLYVLITGAQCQGSIEWTIAEAAAGGADVVQLREKALSDRDLLARARQVRRWTRQAGVLFIVNDRPDIASLAEADGVHVGQEELPVYEVRRMMGPDALVGVSTHNLAQVRQAILDGADYIGVGPTFPSGTKSFPELAGLEFVRQATAATTLPAFVIGGITRDTLPDAVAAGARRAAVSQAIGAADDPRAVAAELRAMLTGG